MKFELTLRRIERKYDPNQPRVPKGNPDGGKWTTDGASDAGKDGGGSVDPIVLSDAVPVVRGELGSEGKIADPLPAGAPFVVLDPHVTPIARGVETIGRRMRLRVVAANRDHGDPSAVELEVRAGALAYQPVAPVHLRARREAGGVRFTWRARRRGLAGVTFAARPDLNEASEAYELEILSGASVARTLSATTPSTLYATSDETLDFGGVQTSFNVRLYQMSAAVGRGLPAIATLTP